MSGTSVDDQASLAAELASGLRHVADFIKANPEFAEWFRYQLTTSKLSLHLTEEQDQAAALARFTRAALRSGAKVGKDIDDDWYSVVATFGAVQAHTLTYREAVCERVVVGTETVTKTVPDPEALAAIPFVEVTETVEKVEWQCKPLLSAEKSTVAS